MLKPLVSRLEGYPQLRSVAVNLLLRSGLYSRIRHRYMVQAGVCGPRRPFWPSEKIRSDDDAQRYLSPRGKEIYASMQQALATEQSQG
ncbi:hypothetical protein PT7_3163 [Pusillimonas sp. T7-7]|nr:hypothetical protein PT7_3163 [Pusillimonas sp. T7-7]